MRFALFTTLAVIAAQAAAIDIVERDPELAQTEAEAEAQAEAEANLEFFSNFVERMSLDSEPLLAQLRSDGASEEDIQSLITDPTVYQGLAQIYADYFAEHPEEFE